MDEKRERTARQSVLSFSVCVCLKNRGFWNLSLFNETCGILALSDDLSEYLYMVILDLRYIYVQLQP